VCSCPNPASRVTDDGRTEYYEVEEAFTMKWNTIRTYMMDYERTVNQIVTGDREDFPENGLCLASLMTMRQASSGARAVR